LLILGRITFKGVCCRTTGRRRRRTNRIRYYYYMHLYLYTSYDAGCTLRDDSDRVSPLGERRACLAAFPSSRNAVIRRDGIYCYITITNIVLLYSKTVADRLCGWLVVFPKTPRCRIFSPLCPENSRNSSYSSTIPTFCISRDSF